MPAFSKAKYIASLPVASATRRYSDKSDFAGQPVHPRLEDLSKPPTRNEHIVATLAHSRGELGTGCKRVALGKRCEFAETLVLMALWKGGRVVPKCTNCHFASNSKAQCSAIPAIASPSLYDEAVKAKRDMEEAKEPQYSALPGHIRHRAAQKALHNEQPRRTVDCTAENLEELSTFTQESFEVPSKHMSLTDPASSSELEEGEEDRKAARKSRMAFLNNLNIREQALRRAQRVGLEEAMEEVKTEREEYLASLPKVRRAERK